MCDAAFMNVPTPQTRPNGPPDAAIYLPTDVLEEIQFNQHWRADRHAGGLLLGQPHQDLANVVFLDCVGFVSGTHVDDVLQFTRHLRLQWKAAIAAVLHHAPGSEVIGWYFSTLTDAEPSQGEMVLHNTFFTLPWQVGLWLSSNRPPRALRLIDGQFQTVPIGVTGNGPTLVQKVVESSDT